MPRPTDDQLLAELRRLKYSEGRVEQLVRELAENLIAFRHEIPMETVEVRAPWRIRHSYIDICIPRWLIELGNNFEARMVIEQLIRVQVGAV